MPKPLKPKPIAVDGLPHLYPTAAEAVTAYALVANEGDVLLELRLSKTAAPVYCAFPAYPAIAKYVTLRHHREVPSALPKNWVVIGLRTAERQWLRLRLTATQLAAHKLNAEDGQDLPTALARQAWLCLLAWVPELNFPSDFATQRGYDPAEVKRDSDGASFLSETFLYLVLGKDDARTLLHSRLPALARATGFDLDDLEREAARHINAGDDLALYW